MSNKAKILYVVQCNKHGTESKSWDGRMVKVSTRPSSKRQRMSGCPICAVEARRAATNGDQYD